MGFWGEILAGGWGWLVVLEGVRLERRAVTSRPERGLISWRVRLRLWVLGGTFKKRGGFERLVFWENGNGEKGREGFALGMSY